MEAVEEPSGPDRPVTPAQVKQVGAGAVVMANHGGAVAPHRDCVQVGHTLEGAVEKLRLAGSLVEGREEIADAGGAVREVRHVSRESGRREPHQAAFRRPLRRGEQAAPRAPGEIENALLLPTAMDVEQKQPDSRVPADDVIGVVPLRRVGFDPRPSSEQIDSPSGRAEIAVAGADVIEAEECEGQAGEAGVQTSVELVGLGVHRGDQMLRPVLRRPEPGDITGSVKQGSQEDHHTGHPIV